MAGVSAATNAAALAAQQAMIKANLKKGKSLEQRKVIDFFFDAGANSGCGCLGGTKTMTMQEYLQLVAQKANSLDTKAMAINKIGLDESEISEIAPIMLASFVYDNDVYVKTDNSNAVSNQYAITWIFFSATQMYTYTYVFDTMGDSTWETTYDFFYTDVTCITTERMLKEDIKIYAGSGCLNQEVVTKNNYVVDRFQITVPNASYTFSMRNGDNYVPSIQAAKAMIREKKFN